MDFLKTFGELKVVTTSFLFSTKVASVFPPPESELALCLILVDGIHRMLKNGIESKPSKNCQLQLYSFFFLFLLKVNCQVMKRFGLNCRIMRDYWGGPLQDEGPVDLPVECSLLSDLGLTKQSGRITQLIPVIP